MILTILIVAATVSLVLVLLLRPYAHDSQARGRFTFMAADLGRFSWAGLVLSSVAGLYLELLLIRWISSEIRIFAYFKNFVLIACFLGFGIGCYLSRRAVRLATILVPLLVLTAFISVPLRAIRQLIAVLPLLLGSSSEMQIWGVGPILMRSEVIFGLLLASVVTLPLFALIATSFIPLGQLVAYYLEAAPGGIAAYSVNVLASFAGIALYTGLCFVDQPPVVWFAAFAILATALFWKIRKVAAAAAITLVVCCAILLFAPIPGQLTFWSPYQKLTLTPRVSRGETIGYQLETNGSWYQHVSNLTPAFASRHPELFRSVPLQLNTYNLPYRFAPHPRSVLILGAGMGNDVAAALRNSNASVTAVEIDPLIVELGREYHPEQPYSSPRVHVVVTDARNYVQNARGQFDLIVFSLLDSHTTSSHFSNIRIDNYVYTREALRAGRRLLAPGGTFIVKFQVQRPWIAGRLNALMTDAFGVQPFQFQSPDNDYSAGGRFLIVCPRQNAVAALTGPDFRAMLERQPKPIMEKASLTTDDWPYFYQRDRGLPASVVVMSLLLLIACVAGARAAGLGVTSIQWEFFFLGGGFLLLEVTIISRMALLFGTTWIVNSIVIAVLLLLIVAANGVAAAAPRIRVKYAYAGILVTIAAAYFVPIESFLSQSFLLRAIGAPLFLSLPVFFAGIVFIKRFAAAGFAPEAIGSNLIGSLAGGLLESLSLWLGLKALLIVAALFYVGAWAASSGYVRARDRDRGDDGALAPRFQSS
ncbi:MAG TPA: methyltransferase domain-containing protein [Thermoanaerobaculia bacterium]|nr:methyltransferase domain-containing protein [Thermoanaerobaculia bacterium]